MILEYREIARLSMGDDLRVKVMDCNKREPHGAHFGFAGQVIWCRGETVRSFPLCQVAHPEVRKVLPCKHTESGGYQCENLEPHTTEHKFGRHTIAHSLSGNGWACEDIDSAQPLDKD